jgi:endonuclease/exonuclease/phosphatase family metal-dependent hydrolase
MKQTRLFLLPALLVALTFSYRAAAETRSDAVLPLFEISISEEDDGLVAIDGPLALLPDHDGEWAELPVPGDTPQLPDTVSVDLTNELLGTGLAKIVVRKGVKSVKKLYQKAKVARAKKIAARNFPRKNGFGTLRIVSYNVGVFHKSGYNKMNMVADMLNEMKADVAGIQELDSCATRTGGVYQLRAFADALGDWNYRFAPAIPFQGGTYGIGIVSKKKFRILDSWAMTLDRGKGAEQRALNVVEFPKFVLAATHLDHRSDAAQLAQAKAITEALSARYAGTHKVVILCGDFNAKPGSKTIRELKKNWTIVSAQNNTYDSSRPKQCIDYIMVLDNNSSYVLRHTAVASKFDDGDVTQASDHLPVYIDIKPKRR